MDTRSPVSSLTKGIIVAEIEKKGEKCGYTESGQLRWNIVPPAEGRTKIMK